MPAYPNISLLITHYNRSKSLENLLTGFQYLQLSFGEIIVSDDGSKAEHQDYLEKIKSKYNFKLIKTPQNKGLGNNINRGQAACEKEYTLYIQEDFRPTDKFPDALHNAVELMEEDNSLDYIRFYAYERFPYLKQFKHGFYKIDIPAIALKYKKIYAYSDHPHLRRSSFPDKFGRYPEGLIGDKTEYKMCISFLQNKGRGLFYNDFKDLFIQKNTSEEPSTMTGSRKGWGKSNNPVISLIRDVYRQFKYNFDIAFMKPLSK